MSCSSPRTVHRGLAGLGLAVLALSATAGTATAAPAVPVPSTTTSAATTAAAGARTATGPAAAASAAEQSLERAAARAQQAARAQAGARPAAPQASLGESLTRGETLGPGDSLVSPNERFRLSFDAESGFLFVTKGTNRLAPEPYMQLVLGAPTGSSLTLQTDGNLVLYTPDNGVAFTTGTAGSTADRLLMQDDGNVVLYDTDDAVLYQTNTDDPADLLPGGTLLPGERLSSDDGATSLIMQADGNLVLYTAGAARFSTGTSTPGSAAVLQTDGNFVVYDPDDQAVFSTGTGGREDSLTFLLVGDREFRLAGVATDEENGVVSVFGSEWGSTTLESGLFMVPGDRRTAPGGVVLIFQEDGNLVEYVNGRVRFAARTSAAIAVMQPDGNFVLYDVDDDLENLRAVFQTRTSRYPGSRLVVQSDANVVVYTPANQAVFSTNR